MNSVPVAIAYAANSQWLPLIGFVLLRRNAMRCYSNLSVVTMTVANGSHQFGIGEGHVWIRRNGAQLAEYSFRIQANALAIDETTNPDFCRIHKRNWLFVSGGSCGWFGLIHCVAKLRVALPRRAKRDGNIITKKMRPHRCAP